MENDVQHIIALLRKGSPEGFRKTAVEFGPRIYALVYDIIGCRSESEEVTSDVLMQVFHSIDSFQPDKGSFLGWIMRIAHNAAISDLRRRNKVLSTEAIPEDIPAPTSEESDQTELVKNAINKCSDAERELIQLYYYDGLSLSEIAEIVSASPQVLAVRLQRIRKKIKQHILNNG